MCMSLPDNGHVGALTHLSLSRGERCGGRISGIKLAAFDRMDYAILRGSLSIEERTSFPLQLSKTTSCSRANEGLAEMI